MKAPPTKVQSTKGLLPYWKTVDQGSVYLGVTPLVCWTTIFKRFLWRKPIGAAIQVLIPGEICCSISGSKGDRWYFSFINLNII